MKEIGMMFKAPLVRAILSGQKTQTRRVAKDVRHPDLGNWYTPGALVIEDEPQHVIHRACPLGQPGDRIYVRETVRSCRAYEVQGYPPSDWGNKPIWFDADGTPPGAATAWATKATPAIHMPKWAARIWLEITDTRLERLQEISNADAQAEGCYHEDPCDHIRQSCTDIGCPGPDYRIGYRKLWEQLNGADSWTKNPWVWVIDFKHIQLPAKEAHQAQKLGV